MRSSAILQLFALGALALVHTGCDRHPVAPMTNGEAVHSAKASLASTGALTTIAQHVEGPIGPGAFYGIDVPANWNGDLVLSAHGYRSPFEPVALGDPGELRDELLERGYAFAYSSYSENGYALKDGAQRTHQLRGMFVRHVTTPARTYLVGRSLGGIVCQKLVEEHPQQYDGALLAAGVLGGTRAELDYISNVRVLFDYFYPGVLPGTLLELPPVDFVGTVVPDIIAAVTANPANLVALASVDQVPIAFNSFPELLQTVIEALGFQFVGLNDFLERTHGRSMFDNANVTYTGPLPPALLADLNENVARFSSTPDVDSYLAQYYEPNGALQVPVLSLHTSRDPIVPLIHEAIYRSAVDAAGSPFLVQRTMDRFGHNNFETSELVQSFEDLVTWVETGVAPSP